MNTMTAFSLFLLSLCVSLITGLVLLGWWMIARERSFQKRHAEQELAFRDAVRREAELSQRLQSALRQQVRYQQQLGRMETHYKERASLIRDLGIEPDRLIAWPPDVRRCMETWPSCVCVLACCLARPPRPRSFVNWPDSTTRWQRACVGNSNVRYPVAAASNTTARRVGGCRPCSIPN